MVQQLLRDFPSSKGSFEYEDYQAAPIRGNASEFITRAIEDNYEAIAKRENKNRSLSSNLYQVR